MSSTLYKKRQYQGKKHPQSLRRERHRPKTFKTEDKAKEYAAKQGMKNFEVVRLQKDKFRVDAV